MVQATKVILDTGTRLGARQHKVDIPNECKYQTISIYQKVHGKPADCQVIMYVYFGGDINVDFNIAYNKGRGISQKSSSSMDVKYNSNTVRADKNNDYYTTWDFAPEEVKQAAKKAFPNLYK